LPHYIQFHWLLTNLNQNGKLEGVCSLAIKPQLAITGVAVEKLILGKRS
jgi:hypothetical protein